MPAWMALGIFILGCGRTNREFEGDPKGDDPEHDPVPLVPGSGGADHSEGTEAKGGSGDEPGDTEQGAAGHPSSGTEAEPEADAGSNPEQGADPEPPPTVYPSDCTRIGMTVKDPNTKITWTTVYECGNDGGAGVYEKANYNDRVGTMDTKRSWFVCWKAGAAHAGNNDIWYYTQGDRAASGWGSRAGWGFMPAINVYTKHDPDSAIPPCKF